MGRKLPKFVKKGWTPMLPKKSKKPALIAKTSVLLDCKPWDDETNMDDMLKEIKKIEMDGLVWGANKLVPVGYGISKLQVMIEFEDLIRHHYFKFPPHKSHTKNNLFLALLK